MGHAAYNRGSMAISIQIDRELEEKRKARRVRCNGKMRNGPDKRYARCVKCGAIDYELYEGDKCRMFVSFVSDED
jgi:hypothetical protein